MIHAQLTKVLFVLDLKNDTRRPEAVIFELPNGLEVKAEPTPELMEYIQGGAAEDEKPSSKEAPAPEPSAQLHEAPPGDPQEVDWMQLPEHVLGLHYKLALQSLGNIKPTLPIEVLSNLVDAIDREFTAEHWAKVGVGTGVPQAAPVKPAVVIQESGLQVAVDERGNPYPRNIPYNEPDPGERAVSEDEDDEDETRQF
jgi:hypothetical protein